MNLPGFGDESTWGPCAGHPLDPRTIDIDDEPLYPDELDDWSAMRAAQQLDKQRAYRDLIAIIEVCRDYGTKQADALVAEALDLIDFLGLGE